MKENLPAVPLFGYLSVAPLSPRYAMPYHQAHALVGSIATRGVYRLPFTGRSGDLVLVAIDSQGRRVAEATVFVGQDPYPFESLLEEMLAHCDPVPQPLRLLS